jgi:protein-tyrosine-phosphatase
VDVAAHEPDTLTRHSRHVRRQLRYPDPLQASASFVTWMRGQLDSGHYHLVFPVTERTATALLPLLEEPGYREAIALPEADSLQQALDKHRTLQLAAQLDIRTPGSWLIADEAELAQLPTDLGYPLVVKPARSIGDNGSFRRQLSVVYAQSADDLAAKVRHFLLFGEVLVQEYIAGDGVGIELIAERGEIQLAFQHRRLHEVPLTGGGSSLRESVEPDPVLLDAAGRLMRAMHWHGVAMVEFKHNRHDGSYALMEVNGRFWGSLPLCIAAGADFPALLHQLMVEGAIRNTPKVRYGVLARKLSADLGWYEQVLRRQGDPAIVIFPGKKQLIKDALLVFSPRHHFDVQQWRDPRPGLVDIRDILSDQWRRIAEQLKLRRQRAQQRRLWKEWIDSGRMRDAKQVLFLCYGNINRSAVAQRLAEQSSSGYIRFRSAGFHAEENRPADPVMRQIAAQSGIDLENWQSRCVDSNMVQNSDMILVMEHAHRERLLADFPWAGQKTLLLGMIPHDENGPEEIADPYGKAPEDYQASFSHLRRCTGALQKYLGFAA